MAITVDRWFWRLDGPAAPVLSPDEEARADRFVRPTDAAAYRAARAGLREVLAGYGGQAPAHLEFTYGPQGKPALEGGPAFNLSHAGGWAALAVAEPGTDLGIDIEAWRPVEEDIARRFFSASEHAALVALTGEDWQRGFFRLWTRKEAVVKALGTGLSLPLDSFDVTLDPEARLTRIAGGDPAEWVLHDLGAGPGMEGALAVRAGGRAVETRLRRGPIPPG